LQAASNPRMAKIYLALGSNLGDKEQNLRNAITAISEQAGKITKISTFYYSKPWGFSSDNDFVNAVICIESELSPFDLLDCTQKIECQLGRTRKTTTTYSDRIIDIDILLYDNLTINSDKLKIPHPHISERDFVFVPLNEIKVQTKNKT
jgi:2-amino-4-hydroxy-6-hydroxymethyldihydropteridine diphosphokinase